MKDSMWVTNPPSMSVQFTQVSHHSLFFLLPQSGDQVGLSNKTFLMKAGTSTPALYPPNHPPEGPEPH